MERRKVSFKQYLRDYIDGPLEITVIIHGELPTGETVDIEMSPEFVPAFKQLFITERERAIEALEMESWLDD